MHRSSPSAWLTLLLAASIFAPLAASAQGPRPAATLLLPYFEIDLADPAGESSLFAVGNVADELVVARATLWTDWAVPTLSFDLAIPAGGAVPVNLRDVFAAGRLPAGELGGASVPGCSDPLSNPALTGGARARLRALHGGEPSPDDGLCYGSGAGGGSAVVGFVTIDVLDACSQEIRNPQDAGYFGDGPAGIAGDRNVLYGDSFAIAPGQDLARGATLVHVEADAERYGPAVNGATFYRFFNGSRQDHRAPPARAWTIRYLAGGAFDGGTELLLWLAPESHGAPGWECGSGSPFNPSVSVGWLFALRSQEGGGETGLFKTPPAFAWRLRVGSEELPADEPFGVLDALPLFHCGVCSPPFSDWRGWMGAGYTASGRFSVGLEAIEREDIYQ